MCEPPVAPELVLVLVRTYRTPAFWCLLKEVETEATAEADLIPGVEVIMVPETTIIAGGLLRSSLSRCCLFDVKVDRHQLSKYKAGVCFPTAGVKVVMATGLQEGPTETATTVTVSPGSLGVTSTCVGTSEPVSSLEMP